MLYVAGKDFYSNMTDESKELVQQARERASWLEHIAIMAGMIGVSYPAPPEFVNIIIAGAGDVKELLDEAIEKFDKAE